MDCSLSGCSVHGILQARILQRVAIPFSGGSSLLGDLPDLGIEPRSAALQADSVSLSHQGSPNLILVLNKQTPRLMAVLQGGPFNML